MENLIEPLQISEEILNKLGHDFIRRYQLKEQINPMYLKSDAHFLIQQLRLYNRAIRQLKSLAKPEALLFDEKLNQVIFKVLHCLSKVIQKLLYKCSKTQVVPRFEQAYCATCGCNLNSKKIKNIQRQMFDYYPLLGRQQLNQNENLQKEKYQYTQDTYVTSEEAIRKKMLILQRNLEDRQCGLQRTIQQFQAFRNDLIIGLPKLNAQDGFAKFNIKEHAFQMGVYFHNNLKKLQNKICVLKTNVKRTEDQQIQCSIDNLQHVRLSQLQNIKLATIRAENEVKRLLEVKSRLEEGARNSQVMIKSLKQQLYGLEDKNMVLQEQFFMEKAKKQPKDKHHKPILLSSEEKPRKFIEQIVKTENANSTASSTDIDVFNEISSQIAQIRSEMESCGTKMSEVVPIIKNSVKRAIDHFLSQRLSSSIDRKKLQFDAYEEDSICSGSKKNIRVESFKAGSNFLSNKNSDWKNSKPNKPEISTDFSISNQLNYKISNSHKSTPHLSILKEKLLEGMDPKVKKGSIPLYKRSALQTQLNQKAKFSKATMSSMTSQLKENLSVHQDSSILKNQRMQDFSPFYKEYMKGTIGGIESNVGKNMRGNIGGLSLNENSLKEVLQLKAPKLSHPRKYKKNISCEELTPLLLRQDLLNFEKDKSLINIKRINAKLIPNQIIEAFLQPRFKSEEQMEIQRMNKEHDKTDRLITSQKEQLNKYEKEFLRKSQKDQLRFSQKEQLRKSEKKQIKAQMAKFANTPKKGQSKGMFALKLDQISYLTFFFTLLARAHVANPCLYHQVRKQIFGAGKNEQQPLESEQTMLRKLVSNLIIQHRKCEDSKQNKLCQHLSSFIQAFQNCIN